MGILDQGTVSATTFLTSIILARYCLKSEYGLYYLVITLLPLWDNLRLALVSTPLIVFLPREKKKEYPVFIGASMVLVMILMLAGGICTGLGAILVKYIANDHALALVLTASSALVVTHILQRYMRGLFHARLQNHYALMISATTGILQLGGIFLLYYRDELTAVNVVLLIASTGLIGSTTGLVLLFTGKSIVFGRSGLRHLWQKNQNFGRWLMWKSIVYTAVLQSLPWFLKFTSDTDSVAALAACTVIVNGINPFWIGFTNSLGPRIAHAFVKNKIPGIRHAVRTGQMILVPMTILVTVGICIFSEPLLHLFYGEKYAGNGIILMGLSVALLLFICTFAMEQGLLTLEKTELVFYIYLWVLCLCSIPVFFMIRAWGIKGVAAGYFLICIFISSLRIIFYYKEMKNVSYV